MGFSLKIKLVISTKNGIYIIRFSFGGLFTIFSRSTLELLESRTFKIKLVISNKRKC